MKAVILAAGKGVRMRSDLPKVLHKLVGKPLISHVIESVRRSGVNDITVVVGYCGEQVIGELGSSLGYVWQREQLGTGHAVLQAKEKLQGYSGSVLVACGDAPLVSSESISALFDSVCGDVKASVLTMINPNPRGYGRIIRGDGGLVDRIVEEKDATDEERLVTEVNTGTYVFDSSLLFEALENIGCDNAQKEYYLPDVVKYINRKGFTVTATSVRDSLEGSGVNSPEELAALEEHVKKTGALI